MTPSARLALFLRHVPGVGRVRLRKFLSHLSVLGEEDLSPKDSLRRLGLSASAADVHAAIDRSEALLSHCRELNVTVHVFGSESYPAQLKRLSDPPAVLFSVGRFDSKRRPRVAVIGTRMPTPWGLRTAEACASEIVDGDGVVVSGLALGIDTAAQSASVEHHGVTWAVLAHGLHTVSPSSNRELATRITNDGALISEYPPGDSPRRHYFVERDRIQAGLADAILVIESGINGGAMHTVRFAQQAGVPVWVTIPRDDGVPTYDELPESQRGTWELLRAGKATRVKTSGTLRKMVRALPSIQASASGLFAR